MFYLSKCRTFDFLTMMCSIQHQSTTSLLVIVAIYTHLWGELRNQQSHVPNSVGCTCLYRLFHRSIRPDLVSRDMASIWKTVSEGKEMCESHKAHFIFWGNVAKSESLLFFSFYYKLLKSLEPFVIRKPNILIREISLVCVF